MTDREEHRLAELIERRHNQSLTAEEFAELEAALLENADARALFLDLGYQHSLLVNLQESMLREKLQPRPWHAGGKWLLPALAAAGLMALAALGIFAASHSRTQVVAELVSSENAAWEGSLPTTPGAELAAGFLRLKTGVATIRFRSGAVVVLEAPAHLVLETPMKGRLLAGAAVIDVPKSAIGFTMETPDGYAIDHGTQFSVSVDESSRHSSFEVLSGEISVHHPPTGAQARLTDQQSSLVSAGGLEISKAPLLEGTPEQAGERFLRIGTGGKAASVIKSNDRSYLRADLLMVKASLETQDRYDRRSLFAFDLSGIDLEKIKSARLRLNLVPSGVGFAARLPEVNRFALYAVKIPVWQPISTWEELPSPGEGVLLGTFEIPRSRQTGSFGIESETLLRYLQENSGGILSCLLVRETREDEGRGLVHAFANDSHPEASGPVLELLQN